MKKLIIVIIALLVVVAVAFGVCLSKTEFDHPEFAGGYESFNVEYSTYDMYLDKNGDFEIVDVGAGNPAICGKITKFPFGENKYLLNCLSDEEFDGTYMNVKYRISVCDAYFTYDDTKEYKGRHIVTLKTKKETMKFLGE